MIKALSKSDIDYLYKLGLQEFKGELWFSKKFLKQTLDTPGYYFGAFEKGKLIGAICVREFDRPKLWVFYFIVDKNFRRHGIGSKLLKKIESVCPKSYNDLFVDFSKENILAKKFYSKHGFKLSGKAKNWFGEGTVGVIYFKKLNS